MQDLEKDDQLILSPTLPEWQADGVVALHRDGHDSQDATVRNRPLHKSDQIAHCL